MADFAVYLIRNILYDVEKAKRDGRRTIMLFLMINLFILC
jgi:hypothetical protein